MIRSYNQETRQSHENSKLKPDWAELELDSVISWNAMCYIAFAWAANCFQPDIPLTFHVTDVSQIRFSCSGIEQIRDYSQCVTERNCGVTQITHDTGLTT